MHDARSGELKPFDFKSLTSQIPELNKFDIRLSSTSFKNPIDSSNMHPDVWVELAKLIEKITVSTTALWFYMAAILWAFTASALKLYAENLNKPVVLTGSQLPIGIIRTDGKENLITAIEIAGAKEGKTTYFRGLHLFWIQVYRGNHAAKYND